MPQPLEIADDAFERMSHDPSLAELTGPELHNLRHQLRIAVARETMAFLHHVWNSPDGEERKVMMDRFKNIAEQALVDVEGNYIESDTETTRWTEWRPGLNNGEKTVREILETLPGFSPEEVHEEVVKFENPSSDVALPGACTLMQHDIIHVLLGRGLVDQDEAFVLGFTAFSDPNFTERDIIRYKHVFSEIYREPYRIRGIDLVAFDLGVQAAREMKVKDLTKMDPDAIMDMKIKDVQAMFGIDVNTLYEFFEIEAQMIPDTPATWGMPRRPQLDDEHLFADQDDPAANA